MPKSLRKKTNLFHKLANAIVDLLSVTGVGCFWVIILYPIFIFAVPQSVFWAKSLLIFCLVLGFIWAPLCGLHFSKRYRNKTVKGTSPPFSFYILLYSFSAYIFFVITFAYAYGAADILDRHVLNQSETLIVDGKTQSSREPVKSLWDYLYFSSITACSLSFDTVPKNNIARFLSALEVFAFWIFVVIRSVTLREPTS